MSERLEYLARRAAEGDFFLASALTAYARGNGLDDAGLADFLGCPVATLTPLRLCRRPTGASAAFRAEVTRIADHFGITGAHLAQVARWADAVAGLRDASVADAAQDERGALLAARDREADGAVPSGEEGPADEHERRRS